MARVSTYLFFKRETEAAFNFYKQVFGTEFIGGIDRFGSAPEDPNNPVPDEDKDLIMNIQLPILAGHVIMGSDSPESMNFNMKRGNNVNINLEPDTLQEAQRLFNELSAGGEVDTPLQKMFWGDYFASFKDKFGICWMIIVSE